MLRLAGVQLVPFSPLHDTQLPPGLSGVLLGGGAVAEHAAHLSSNASMLGALRAFAQAGGLVVGEAGGLMYLSQSLQRQQHGQRHFMGKLSCRASQPVEVSSPDTVVPQAWLLHAVKCWHTKAAGTFRPSCVQLAGTILCFPQPQRTAALTVRQQ